MDILKGILLIQNQQLFSEAYVREVRVKAHTLDVVSACRQTIREWREEYTDLSGASLSAYVRQVLSSLGVSYSPAGLDGLLLEQTGLCIID